MKKLLAKGNMKKLFVFTLIFTLLLSMSFSCFAKTNKPIGKYLPDTELLERAFEEYKDPEPELTHRRFKHRHIEPLITNRVDSEVFDVKKLGESVQGRSIYQLKHGNGDTKVMLWSQMHGDESTATRALFDIFNFLEGQDDEFAPLRDLIAENTTLYFIPMLNPDGAEVFTRRNDYDIDINRDANFTATPEGKILKATAQEVKPDFGFNLHDMNIYTGVSGTTNPATLSLLSPAFNYACDINPVRERAMQVIAGMNNLLQQDMKDHVGRYDDAFCPRCFGDNFSIWGTSTILIESGGYKDDPDKEFIRKMNFKAILTALAEIASENYKTYNKNDYFAIPDNASSLLTDVLIRNLTIKRENIPQYEVDLSIRRNEVSTDNATDYYVNSSIYDLGDLSSVCGYNELDASGYTWKAGNVYGQMFDSVEDIDMDQAWQLLKEGYYAVQIKNTPSVKHHNLPIMVISGDTTISSQPRTGSQAHFFMEKDGNLDFAVVNGYLIDLNRSPYGFYKNYVR